MDIKIVYFGDDWVALYLNGKLVYGDHSISADEILKVLDIPFEVRSVSYPIVEEKYEFETPENFGEFDISDFEESP